MILLTWPKCQSKPNYDEFLVLRTNGFPLMLTPPSTSYPDRCKRTHRIVQLAGGPAVLAGRLVKMGESGCGRLRDDSGEVVVHFESPPGVDCVGDIVEVDGEWVAPTFHVRDFRLLAPGTAASTGIDLEILELRSKVLSGIRAYFSAEGFLEVETPLLLKCPGMEPHLTAFETRFADPDGPVRDLYLPTSPEFAMKRLLASGAERIYQICKSFRHEEAGKFHTPEFTILEWYRAFEQYESIMEDSEALIHSLVVEIFGNSFVQYRGNAIDVSPPWERLTVMEAMYRYAGIDVDPDGDPDQFVRAARSKGHSAVLDTDSSEVAFTKVFLDAVEGNLGNERPTILMEYPASMVALSKRRPGRYDVAERFEIYISGVELANAFAELNDPAEQRERFRTELDQRKADGNAAYDLDEQFLSALDRGMPPAAGIALGVDRLLMLLADKERIQDVISFPFPNL